MYKKALSCVFLMFSMICLPAAGLCDQEDLTDRVTQLLESEKYDEAAVALDELESQYPDAADVVPLRDLLSSVVAEPDDMKRLVIVMEFLSNKMKSVADQIKDLNTAVDDLNTLTSSGSDLSTPIAKGDVDEVKRLLNEGSDPNGEDFLGSPVIMTAVSKGYFEIVSALLDKGADLNTELPFGSGTILIYAAAKGHAEIVQELISRGADIHAQNSDGETALVIAQKKGHLHVVEILQGK